MTAAKTLSEAFHGFYGGQAKMYRAPGRVNLIGEHTDYNQGFVMPAAIDFSTWIAIASRRDRKISVRSENFSETAELDLECPPTHGTGHWSDYPFGVAVKLEQAGYRLRGADLLVRGEVPIGSGLSSSAAIEVATGLALLGNSEIEIARLELAKVCQQAEHEYAGTRCGIMDQFISCLGQAGHALMLDSQSLPGVQSLRDVSADEVECSRGDLPDRIFRRCRHVVTENARVIAGAAALNRGDLPGFGELMRQSHQSLREDYEVSCIELDLMAELAHAAGAIGARMTGGGFGGCTINLVASNSVESFKQKVASGYAKATGRTPEIYVCSAAGAAEQLAQTSVCG